MAFVKNVPGVSWLCLSWDFKETASQTAKRSTGPGEGRTEQLSSFQWFLGFSLPEPLLSNLKAGSSLFSFLQATPSLHPAASAPWDCVWKSRQAWCWNQDIGGRVSEIPEPLKCGLCGLCMCLWSHFLGSLEILLFVEAIHSCLDCSAERILVYNVTLPAEGEEYPGCFLGWIIKELLKDLP